MVNSGISRYFDKVTLSSHNATIPIRNQISSKLSGEIKNQATLEKTKKRLSNYYAALGNNNLSPTLALVINCFRDLVLTTSLKITYGLE